MKLFFAVELQGSFAEHDDLVDFVTVSLATRVEIYNAPASIAASSLVKSGQWSSDSAFFREPDARLHVVVKRSLTTSTRCLVCFKGVRRTCLLEQMERAVVSIERR